MLGQTRLDHILNCVGMHVLTQLWHHTYDFNEWSVQMPPIRVCLHEVIVLIRFSLFNTNIGWIIRNHCYTEWQQCKLACALNPVQPGSACGYFDGQIDGLFFLLNNITWGIRVRLAQLCYSVPSYTISTAQGIFGYLIWFIEVQIA